MKKLFYIAAAGAFAAVLAGCEGETTEVEIETPPAEEEVVIEEEDRRRHR